jgi:N-acetyl-1-D-myo-inositol-2-amino-2-deoxy-alpha-D-glucopyranoside deacetylase
MVAHPRKVDAGTKRRGRVPGQPGQDAAGKPRRDVSAGRRKVGAMTSELDAPAGEDADRRLLLVHAHPDDETITCGITMARYVAQGAQVTLVTCTLGEEGEVLVPELAHLAADREDRLGPHRIGELADAMAALGVTDHRFLGGPGRYRDSGMIGTPANERPDCFWRADLDEAASHLVPLIRELRPQVLVTYDEQGGYGHPDHIQAHRVALCAADLAARSEHAPEAGEPWAIAKTYFPCLPRSMARAGANALREAGDNAAFEAFSQIEQAPFVVDDDLVSAVIADEDQLAAKDRALRAYPTQIAVDGPFFALSNNLGQQIFAAEHYRLAAGKPGPVGPDGLEHDLFAGLADAASA